MASARPRALIEIAYEQAAQDYLISLSRKHFIESIAQATQRRIFLESMDLVHARRPDVQSFNELLVEYAVRGQYKPGQVVPDNMVVVCDQPIKAQSSFNLPLQPEKPFWMLGYVSRSNKRKDYEDNFDKYERQLKVPYCLIFDADEPELTVYHHNGKKYVSVRANKHGRFAIPELEMELALLDGWVRFWFRGELLPLPGDLQQELDETKRQLAEAKEEAVKEKLRADKLQRQIEQLQQELAKLQASAGRRTNGAKPDK